MSLVRPSATVLCVALLAACSTFGGNKDAEVAKAKDGRISILTFEQKLEADPALKDQRPAIADPVAFADWVAPGGPPDNAPPHVAAASEPKVAWRKQISGSTRRSRVSAPPVIAGGRVYILNADNELVVLDAATGDKVWSKALAPRRGRDRVALAGGVAVSGDRVFVTSGFGFAAALSTESGDEIWRHDSPTPFHAAPTVAGNRMFTVNSDGELVALDAGSGTELWSYQAIAEPARILSASSPAVRDDIVVAPFASGQVVAFVPANGRRLWEDALTRAGRLTSLSSINDVAGRPVAVDGFIYAASHSGILAAIDQRTGQRVWARGVASTQTPFVSGDTLFVVSTDAELTAIERASGRPFWVTPLKRYRDEDDKKGRIAWTGPLLVGGRLFLASSEGQGAFVDPENGAVLRTMDLGGAVFVPPVASDGRIFVLTNEGKLVVLK